MDFQLSKMHLLQQELFRKFAETEIRPLAKEMDEKEAYDLDLLAKMQRCGFFGIPYSRRRRHAGLYPVHGGGLQGGCLYRYHYFRAHLPVLLLHQQLRHRGAEAEVPASSGGRQPDRLLRPDGDQRRLRRTGRPDRGREGRRGLDPERLQDLHHQLRLCRCVHRLCFD